MSLSPAGRREEKVRILAFYFLLHLPSYKPSILSFRLRSSWPCYRGLTSTLERLFMFRTFFLTMATISLSSTAFAHPDPSDAPKPTTTITKPQLPSADEISQIIEQMPDMNALMGGMMGIIKDEKFKDQMESSAKAFKKRMDTEGVFEKGADGMPDFNKALEVMLGTFSDEEAMGGMLETITGLAEAMEEIIPEDAKKTVPKP